MAKIQTTPLTITLPIQTTSSPSGYHTAGSSNQTDFRVRVHYIFRAAKSLLVGLKMV